MAIETSTGTDYTSQDESRGPIGSAAVSAPASSSSSVAPAHYTTTNNPTPTFGEQNAGIGAFQQQLNATNKGVAGYKPLVIDNKYGPLTQAAAQFQAPSNGLLPRVTGNGQSPAPNQTPSDTNQFSEEDTQYQHLLDQSSGLIAATNQKYTDELKTSDAASAARVNAGGLAGSTSGGKIVSEAEQPILDAREADLQGIYSNIQQLATTAAETAYTNAQTSIAALAQNPNFNLSQYKLNDPVGYNNLVAATGGNPSVVDGMIAQATPPQNVAQTYLTTGPNGSVYNQLVVDPKGINPPHVQTYDLGVTLPANSQVIWKGTTAALIGDPTKDPSTWTTWAVNPLTGQLSEQSGGPTNSSAPAGNSISSAVSTVAQVAGISDPTLSLSSIVTNPDGSPNTDAIDGVVNGIIQNEGGPKAAGYKLNNPGDIEYYKGLPGATDSGVSTNDPNSTGTTWAKFATYDAGVNAIANMVTKAANGQSPQYGQSPTLASFINQYTGTTVANSSQSNSSSSGNYGLLSNVPGFDPVNNPTDAAAANYLTEYLSQGKTPTPQSLGLSTRSGSGAIFNEIANTARTLYKQATGQNLPNTDVLSGYIGNITANNTLLNQLNVQTGTVGTNIALLKNNIENGDVNTSAPAINKIVNALAAGSGSPDVATYLAQNETIKTELASLLSIKNASGTTVADKLSAGDILPSGATSDQITSIVNTLLKEAQNQSNSINTQNAKLYIKTDPLGINPENPVNQTISLTDPSGEAYQFNPGQLTTEQLQSAFDDGYTLTSQ